MDALFQQFFHRRNDCHRQFITQRQFEPLLGRFGRPDRLEQRIDFLRRGKAIGVEGESLFLCEVGHAQHLANAAPLAGRYDGDADQALFRLVNTDGIVTTESVDARPRARFSGVPSNGRFVFGDVDGGFVDADREGAGTVIAAEQPAGGGDKRSKAGDRRPLGWPGQCHEPRQRACNGFRSGEVAVRAVFAEPIDRGDREAGIFRRQVRPCSFR